MENQVKSASALLSEEVSALVSDKSKGVREQVVKTLADKEVELRVACVMACVDKLKEEKNKLNKLKPDTVFFGEDGKETKQFSKQKFEERKKLLETIEKLEAALTLAFDKNEFQKVKELSGKAKEQKEESKEENKE